MTNIELLRKYSLFQEMDKSELERVAKIVDEKRYNCHEVIFSNGENGGNLYLIKQGTVKISLPINGSQQYERVAVLGAGEYFGELSFLDGREHSAKAETVEDAELLVLNSKNYQMLVREDKKREMEMQIELTLKVISLLRDMNKKYSHRPFAQNQGHSRQGQFR